MRLGGLVQSVRNISETNKTKKIQVVQSSQKIEVSDYPKRWENWSQGNGGGVAQKKMDGSVYMRMWISMVFN